MRAYLFPPFLPLLACSILLLGRALYESSLPVEEMPTSADGEVLRWVMFVPILIVPLFLYFLCINLVSIGIQRVWPSRFQIFAFCFSGLAGGVVLNLVARNEPDMAWRVGAVIFSFCMAFPMIIWHVIRERKHLKLVEQGGHAKTDPRAG